MNAAAQAQMDPSAAGKGLGIAAIVCGGLGLCVPGLALIGLVLGLVGLVLARPGGRMLPGIGTGVNGGAFVINLLLIFAILLPPLGAARITANTRQEQRQLQEILKAFTAYASDDKLIRYPNHAADLVDQGYLKDHAVFLRLPKPPMSNLLRTKTSRQNLTFTAVSSSCL